MKYIKTYELFEGINGQNDYTEGDIVVIRFEVTKGDPILTPVKIIKRFTRNKFLVSHKVEDSQLKNFPDIVIKHSMIISRYKDLDTPYNDTHITQNPRISPDTSGMIPGSSTQPNSDRTQLPANQNPSNDIAI